MPNLLITSAGRRVSLTNCFKKELKSFFPNAKVIAADQFPEYSAAAQIADDYIKLPSVNSSSYIEKLLEACLEHEIKLIIPTIDTELLVLAENKDEFLKHQITPVVSSPAFIKICNDKRKTHSFFAERNFKTAKEYSKESYELPIFIKPVSGSASSSTHIIKHANDISKSQLLDDNLMFLEYLDQELFSEYTCDLYYDRGNQLICTVPRKRIETRGGEISKGVTKKSFLTEVIKKELNHVPGAIGCVTAQFFVNNEDGQIFAIEINPRFGGGFPLSYLAGANYPSWIIKEYLLDEKIEKFDLWKENLLMLRYDHEILVENFDE